MFEKYDEVMHFFEIYLLDKINNSDFEIKGAIQTLRNVMKQYFNVEIPVLMDKEKSLIHSCIRVCLDAKRESEIAYRVFYLKKKTLFNHESLELKDAKKDMDSKVFKYSSSKIELKKACEKYARAICISMYDGPLNIELLEYLTRLGYDGNYGSENLRLMYSLYVENKELENVLDNVRKRNEELTNELACLNYLKECYEIEMTNLKKSVRKLNDDLNHANVLVDYYKNESNEGKKMLKKHDGVNKSFRIYGK